MLTKVIVCPVAGPPEVIEIASDDLEKLQSLVGGYITLVPSRCLSRALSGLTVYVNDEGAGLPLNTKLRSGHPLYGTAIITHTTKDGEDDGLTPCEIDEILKDLA